MSRDCLFQWQPDILFAQANSKITLYLCHPHLSLIQLDGPLLHTLTSLLNHMVIPRYHIHYLPL